MFGNSNSGTTYTNNKGCVGSIECWINKEGIANIFSIPKLEEMGFCITYYIQDGHYIVHTKDGRVQLNKDELGLPDIDTKKNQDVVFIQIINDFFDGLTKK